MVETKTFVCEQCVKQGVPRELRTFQTLEKAEEHAAEYHTNRFVEMYQRAYARTERAQREMNLNHMLRDRLAHGLSGEEE